MPTPSRNRATVRNAVAGTAHIGLACAVAVLWLAWQAIRAPLLTFLVIFEPIVSFLLSASALLTTLTALLWAFTDPTPLFPCWAVLSGSLICALLLALYHALIRALTYAPRFRSCNSPSTSRQ